MNTARFREFITRFISSKKPAPTYTSEELVHFCEHRQFFVQRLNSTFPNQKKQLLEINQKIFYFRMDHLSAVLALAMFYDFHGPDGIRTLLKEPYSFNLHTLNGIYPLTVDSLAQFADQYIKALKNCTYVGCWKKDFVPEHYLIQKYCLNKQIYFGSKTNNIFLKGHFGDLYWFNRSNWYEKLNGKKILIISSHCESMKKQWFSDRLFKANAKEISHLDTNIQLEFIKPPNSIGGLTPNRSWIESLQILKDEVASIGSNFQFDMALVSCGGYGAPICNYIAESLGKSVFYLGGALQLYFCIKGKRWDKNQIYNEHWTAVDPKEIPENYQLIEGGCYW